MATGCGLHIYFLTEAKLLTANKKKKETTLGEVLCIAVTSLVTELPPAGHGRVFQTPQWRGPGPAANRVLHPL